MHGRDEVGVGDRQPLVIGDRHRRHFAEAEIERLEIGPVLPAIKVVTVRSAIRQNSGK